MFQSVSVKAPVVLVSAVLIPIVTPPEDALPVIGEVELTLVIVPVFDVFYKHFTVVVSFNRR